VTALRRRLIAEGLSNASVNRRLATLRGMPNLALRWQLFDGRNPAASPGMLPEAGRDRYLTAEHPTGPGRMIRLAVNILITFNILKLRLLRSAHVRGFARISGRIPAPARVSLGASQIQRAEIVTIRRKIWAELADRTCVFRGKSAWDSDLKLPPLGGVVLPDRWVGEQSTISSGRDRGPMPAERVSLRRVREILRLKHERGASVRTIAVAIGVARSTVQLCLARAAAVGLAWSLPATLTDGGLESRPHPEQGFRACLGILRLQRSYGRDRVEAACARGLEIGARSYGNVQSILQHGLDRQPAAAPSRAGELPLVHPNIRSSRYYH
jgi:hypothetical protein